MGATGNNWQRFEARFADWFKSFETPELTFRSGWRSIPGLPTNSFRSDAVLTDGLTLIAVEVEVGQAHPDTNVGKYWFLAEKCRYARVVLFHVYTPSFKSYRSRKALGEFYARKMREQFPFEYVQFDERNAVDADATFQVIAGSIAPYIEDAFRRQRPAS